ncbi:hypothetical protein GUJ93_ZPchr0004g39916 [Zizania palustris]|uniref:Uncharacterized protein n=1 Tax=Zizania palustris TaxID=103762 RepID=A0A8J5RWU4_ZIZPA|nr:hypothetical protein GUJ93_ZPchr0004g39916 [Zizania palustris]
MEEANGDNVGVTPASPPPSYLLPISLSLPLVRRPRVPSRRLLGLAALVGAEGLDWWTGGFGFSLGLAADKFSGYEVCGQA